MKLKEIFTFIKHNPLCFSLAFIALFILVTWLNKGNKMTWKDAVKATVGGLLMSLLFSMLVYAANTWISPPPLVPATKEDSDVSDVNISEKSNIELSLDGIFLNETTSFDSKFDVGFWVENPDGLNLNSACIQVYEPNCDSPLLEAWSEPITITEATEYISECFLLEPETEYKFYAIVYADGGMMWTSDYYLTNTPSLPNIPEPEMDDSMLTIEFDRYKQKVPDIPDDYNMLYFSINNPNQLSIPKIMIEVYRAEDYFYIGKIPWTQDEPIVIFSGFGISFDLEPDEEYYFILTVETSDGNEYQRKIGPICPADYN